MQVLPLASITSDDIADALSEEVECWRRHLYWDYEPAVRIIKRHIDSRSLPGFCLQDRTAIVGYCYFVVNSPVGYLGNVYVRQSHAGAESYAVLLKEATGALFAKPEVKRIESQVFGFNCDVTTVFERQGMVSLLRHFMVKPLEDSEPAHPDKGRHFRIVGWDRAYFLPVAEVIRSSYEVSPDFNMCYDYQSREGCVRFLHNLVDNPGCGVFDGTSSRIALDTDGRVCGVIISSIIGPRTGMIPQISVKRPHQGSGVGTALLNSYMAAARRAGLDRTTLSVSDQNEAAYRLYQRLGFRTVFDFHAFVWTRGD